MNRFTTGVTDYLVEECSSAFLHDNMNNSCHIVHAQQVEEILLRRMNREAKRVNFL